MTPMGKDDRDRLRPVLVDVVETEDGGRVMEAVTPGLQHNDRRLKLMVEDFERDHGGMAPLDPSDVADMAVTYPRDRFDRDEAIDERVLRIAGILVEFGLSDRDGFKLALSTAVKKLHLQGRAGDYDQRIAGRSSSALDAIAGHRHGAKPARLMYRLVKQSALERWWTSFGHDDQIESRLRRRLSPGPVWRVEDASYWIVDRGVWHCYRPVNGRMEVTANAHIPTDAPPEEMLGNDYKVYEGLPQKRVADPGRQTVRTDVDLLFTALGGRNGRRSLMFGEWIDLFTGIHTQHGKKDEEEDEEPSRLHLILKPIIKAAAVLAVMITALAIAIMTTTGT